MVSTYTTRKRLEKQTPGENNNSWGSNLNANTIDIIDECFGVVCVAMTTAGDSTLSQANGATDEGRRSQIILTGAPTSDVRLFVPAAQSFYLVRNKMTGTKRVRLTNSGGTNGVDFSGSGSGAEQGLVISDGTNVREVFRTVSIGGFSGFVSSAIAAVSDAPTDATGGNLNDRIPFYDASETGAPLNKVAVSAFLNNAYNDMTEEATVSVSDGVLLYAESDSTLKKANIQSILKVVNTLTEETTPNIAADYVLAYNTSVGQPRKILMNNASKGVNVGTKTGDYTVTTSDRHGSITYSGMSANATITLPTLASFGYGNILWFAHEDTGVNPAYYVTFDGNGSETVDGQTTRKAWSGSRFGLMATTSGWKTVVGNWVVLSTQGTPTPGVPFTFTHEQPRAPSQVSVLFVNVTPVDGYSAGDLAYSESGYQGASGNRGVVYGGNSTILYCTTAHQGYFILDRSDGTPGTVDSASNWKVIIRAVF